MDVQSFPITHHVPSATHTCTLVSKFLMSRFLGREPFLLCVGRLGCWLDSDFVTVLPCTEGYGTVIGHTKSSQSCSDLVRLCLKRPRLLIYNKKSNSCSCIYI